MKPIWQHQLLWLPRGYSYSAECVASGHTRSFRYFHHERMAGCQCRKIADFSWQAQRLNSQNASEDCRSYAAGPRQARAECFGGGQRRRNLEGHGGDGPTRRASVASVGSAGRGNRPDLVTAATDCYP